jgi:tetratricopeptide (TPR) repeat protein
MERQFMKTSDLENLREKAKQLALSDEWGPQAIAINTQMIELDEHAADAYTRLAKCFLAQNKIIAAYDMYKQVLEFDPKNRIAANNVQKFEDDVDRARVREREKQVFEDIASINSYEEAFNVGVAAKRQGNFKLAVALLERALELKPNNVYACNALGAAYRRNRNSDDARRVYQTALSIAVNFVSLVGLAAVERDARQFKEAISLYERVLSSEPQNAYALNGLGGVHTDLGNYSTAESFFNKAMSINKGTKDAKRGLEKLLEIYKKLEDSKSIERIEGWLKTLSTKKSRF